MYADLVHKNHTKLAKMTNSSKSSAVACFVVFRKVKVKVWGVEFLALFSPGRNSIFLCSVKQWCLC